MYFYQPERLLFMLFVEAPSAKVKHIEPYRFFAE